MKKKREDKLHGARSEQDLKKQLAEIERAARGAIAEDRVQSGNLFRLNVNFCYLMYYKSTSRLKGVLCYHTLGTRCPTSTEQS